MTKCFTTVLVVLALSLSVSAEMNWDLIDEDFEADFGAFTTVEHTGADRTAEVDNGFAVFKFSLAAKLR